MSDGQGLSRRSILGAAAAAAVTLPVIARAADDDPKGGAKGGASADRTPSSVPATDPAHPAAAAPGAVTAKALADGWLATVKPAAIADDSFQTVTAQPFVLARKGSEVYALSTKCTHKGCAVKPAPAAAGKDAELLCPCHKAQYSLTGTVTKAPATKPLARYKLRVGADGLIEVNTAAVVEGEGPETVVTIKA
jgi:Rieske Fe-S protein